MAIEKFNFDDEIDWCWESLIRGEPASKANSRRIVKIGNAVRIIKSRKALTYVDSFALQIKKVIKPIEEDVLLYARIYYASRRPDLDESLIMDCLQKFGIVKNDRQIKEKIILWGLDRDAPRAELRLALC